MPFVAQFEIRSGCVSVSSHDNYSPAFCSKGVSFTTIFYDSKRFYIRKTSGLYELYELAFGLGRLCYYVRKSTIW